MKSHLTSAIYAERHVTKPEKQGSGPSRVCCDAEHNWGLMSWCLETQTLKKKTTTKNVKRRIDRRVKTASSVVGLLLGPDDGQKGCQSCRGRLDLLDCCVSQQAFWSCYEHTMGRVVCVSFLSRAETTDQSDHGYAIYVMILHEFPFTTCPNETPFILKSEQRSCYLQCTIKSRLKKKNPTSSFHCSIVAGRDFFFFYVSRQPDVNVEWGGGKANTPSLSSAVVAVVNLPSAIKHFKKEKRKHGKVQMS